MADSKGGSDLDVFEGLTKKPAGRPSLPPPGPVPSRPGGLGGGSPPLAPPPGPGTRPKTMLGLAPPPAAGAPLPPPSMPAARTTQTLPAVALPPGKPSVAMPPGPPPSKLPPTSLPPVGLPPLAPPPKASPVEATIEPDEVQAASGADMDWDDEDEKTSIYDKEETAQQLSQLAKPRPAAGKPLPAAGAKTAALAAAGGAAAAPLPAPLPPPAAAAPAPAAAPPAPAPAAAPAPAPAAAVAATAPSRFDATQVVQKPAATSKGPGMLIGAIVGIAALAGVVYTLMPKQGNLIVQVKSGGRTVENVQVFVNQTKVCDNSPCRVVNLEKGTVTVKATAPGYESGTEFPVIRANEDASVTIELPVARDAAATTAATAAPAAKAGTGIKVSGSSQVKLSVDGKEIGALPQELKDLTPGEHKLKFSGGDRYQAEEKTITVSEHEVKDLGSIALKVIKGKATLNLETTGARVTLVSGTERKSIPQFPLLVDIDTSKTWVIEATKAGFEDFKLPITFDNGEAEKTFAIALTEKGKKAAEPAPASNKTPDTKAADAKAADAKAAGDKAAGDKKVESGSGTLNINSVPPSNCILDGRPLGATPKLGVSVPAGSHTVVFVHPEKGRKTQSVTVKGGETKTVAVKF